MTPMGRPGLATPARGLSVVAGLAAAAAAGGLASQAVAATSPPRAQLTHFVCREGLRPFRRELAVTAVMRPLTGTEHMAIKFSLLRRASGQSSFTQVHSGDLDRWITPPNSTLGQRPGDVWELNKVVSNLSGPATYRLRAQFRWRGAHDELLGDATRATPSCYESQ